MGDYIEVNINTLHGDIETLNTTLRNINQDMTKMFESVEQLDAMWTGIANETFVKQFEHDKGIFEEISNAVKGVIESMENAEELYRKCEQNVSSEIDDITIR